MIVMICSKLGSNTLRKFVINPVSLSTNWTSTIMCNDSLMAMKCNATVPHVEGYNGLLYNKIRNFIIG